MRRRRPRTCRICRVGYYRLSYRRHCAEPSHRVYVARRHQILRGRVTVPFGEAVALWSAGVRVHVVYSFQHHEKEYSQWWVARSIVQAYRTLREYGVDRDAAAREVASTTGRRRTQALRVLNEMGAA